MHSRSCNAIPTVNQVEAHVFFQQKALQEALEAHGAHMPGMESLCRRKKHFFTHPLLRSIGHTHGQSPAQIGLKYLFPPGISVIPKSSHRERVKTWCYSTFTRPMRICAGFEPLMREKPCSDGIEPSLIDSLRARLKKRSLQIYSGGPLRIESGNKKQELSLSFSPPSLYPFIYPPTAVSRVRYQALQPPPIGVDLTNNMLPPKEDNRSAKSR